jgi:peptidoglycan/LPS O-acetylase OafA/YrhL
MIRLGEVVEGRDNNVRVLRHVAALMVIVFHCYALTAVPDDDPLHRLVPDATLGTLGVQIFFALSGFLVTQSFLAHRDLGAFVAARVLRIYPALVVATLFTIVLASFTSTLPLADYFADPQTRRYFWQTATGYAATGPLPGAFAHNPYPHAANGSLWTLPIELRLYAVLAVAGVVGVLAHRRVAALVAAVLAMLLVHAPWPLSLVFDVVPNRSLLLIFLGGALAYICRDAVLLSLVAAAAAVALYLAVPRGFVHSALTLPIVVYTVLVVAYHPRLRIERLARGADFSYGLYVYAFPVQQTILATFAGIGAWTLLVATLPLVAAMAALSWFGIERPALALKSRFSTPAGSLP